MVCTGTILPLPYQDVLIHAMNSLVRLEQNDVKHSDSPVCTPKNLTEPKARNQCHNQNKETALLETSLQKLRQQIRLQVTPYTRLCSKNLV